ncbi:MAG: DNA repair protein RadA [Firmicutes bacterium]|nr:DNA repair protein RadA [Bacillota bacterium]MBQ4092331.1 DNA repair protein RadA [Bacillota bacterium]
MAKKAKTAYVCDNCGHEAVKWMGCCPTCGEWNTFQEFKIAPTTKNTAPLALSKSEAKTLREIDLSEGERFTLGDEELDLIFGGGIVIGSVILLGGEPGIGKSTFLTQVASGFAERHGRVLYATGEESLKQVRLRAMRLEAEQDDFYLLAENNLNLVFENVQKLEPKLLIVDSIQTLFDDTIDSISGSVAQIRECTAKLLQLAKREHITVMIAGHVTKEGVIAGPRLLEHMVDVVMYFEGRRYQDYRILRSVKNRFGSTNEVALLEMTETGLKPFHNPSALFLSERGEAAPGSGISAVMEGTRPFLVELQALVAKTNFGNPRRLASGIEYNRLLLILAVLEKILKLPFGMEDVYVNVAGGLRIDDPSSDLAVAAAVVSSFRNLPLREGTVMLGEIGLGGELRSVGEVEKRIREGIKFGFKRFIVPAYNYDKKQPVYEDDVEVIRVSTLAEALKYIF